MNEAARVVDLPARPYVAVAGDVTMETFPEIADRLPEVFGWLGARGLALAGPPFFRYVVMGGSGMISVEAGVPLLELPPDVTGVLAGVLPAGRYAATTYVGHPRGLRDATARLLTWGREAGLSWDMTQEGDDEHWTARLELLETDPREQPDPEQWRTRLEIRTA
ncbi:MAG: AraC family transcriptional regulator [Nocardioidaceae bacterium]|nr:AraC family transcriptional regulator [Nocardioidaceae bacterium]